MRAYVIRVDQIFECDGKPDDDEFRVYSAPPDSGLVGSIIGKNTWASTKDYAYVLLEWSLKIQVTRWKEAIEAYEKAGNTYDMNYGKDQLQAFENMLPKCREMDPMFLRKTNKK